MLYNRFVKPKLKKMKKTAFAMLFMASTLFACDNNSDDVNPDDVPAAVKETLLSSFPDAADIDWEQKGDDYEADFDVNKVDYSALFNASGSLIKHKQDIPESELPDAVRAAINTDYAAYRLDDIERLEEGQTMLYQVELDNNTKDEKLVYSADGQQAQQVYWD